MFELLAGLTGQTIIGIEAVLNVFVPIHFGTFGGLPTRILSVFVGLSPTILFVTGFIMYRYRRRRKSVTETNRELIER